MYDISIVARTATPLPDEDKVKVFFRTVAADTRAQALAAARSIPVPAHYTVERITARPSHS